jgi:adenylate cyclase class 1
MHIKRALNPNYSEGVDRKLLKQLYERFMWANQQRYDRARGNLSIRHRDLLDLLPLLFHVNHPLLPGYVSRETPWGVANYQPEKAILQSVQRFSKTFRFKYDRRHNPAIHSLFMMGSVGSIAHTGSSDIDIWLCHQSGLNPQEQEALQLKSERISEWADKTGLEIHFFLMDAEAFRQGKEVTQVDDESSGSAQHFLLLDEFYRTSVLMAGRYPLWWLIPPEQEKKYDQLAELLLTKRFIRTTDVIDFGGVSYIPPGEFVGAGMWQLYKGIDSPYKSVLKLLLTEAYAQELPEKSCLSIDYKQTVYNDQMNLNDLDPYVMFYRRLEQYLTGLEDVDRLELVRRSFYLKVGQNLTSREQSKQSWQSKLMQHLVESWQWSKATLEELDHRQQWKISQVMKERKRVVKQLTHSYRFLSQFARAQKLKATINAEDMNILGRKLYAVFQRKAGKIEFVNAGIAPNLREDDLAFHHLSNQGIKEDIQGWLLYTNLSSPEEAFYQPVIKRTTSLLDMVAWCYFNGLIDLGTRISLEAGNTQVRRDEIRKIIETFQQLIRMPLPEVSQTTYRQPAYLKHTLLFVNLGIEPTSDLDAKGMQRISARNDPLGYSSQRENLVLTLDQIDINSWNEVMVYRYELGYTLIQCLKNYLAKLLEHNAEVPELNVRCFSRQRAKAIADRVQELFQDVIENFLGKKGDLASRYIIEMDRRFFVIQFFDRQPRFTGLETKEELTKYLGQTYSSQHNEEGSSLEQYSFIKIDRHALKDDPCLRRVCQASLSEAIQVFFRINKSSSDRDEITADVYIIDEIGALFKYESLYHDTDSLLVPLQRFLNSVLERRQMQQPLDSNIVNVALRFFELIPEPDSKNYRLERREVKPRASAFFVDVQAIGSQQFSDNLEFDIFCDQQEFAAMEYGDELIPAVASYIKSRRRNGEYYPCYITDLGLPNDVDLFKYQEELQTVQYLRYKLQLESRLNAALREMSIPSQ